MLFLSNIKALCSTFRDIDFSLWKSDNLENTKQTTEVNNDGSNEASDESSNEASDESSNEASDESSNESSN